jgi:plastocyanin
MKKLAQFVVIMLTSAFALAAPAYAGEIKGKINAEGLKSAENIAVYVDAIWGKGFPAPAKHVTVDQKRMRFIPHVVVVQKGTTVDFLNSDPISHNVYWRSISGDTKLGHNLGAWSKDDIRSFQFNDLGVAPLRCHIHPEMSAYIVIVPTPYFAVTDKEGNFVIKDVPPGKYTLKTWSEEGKAVTQAVELAGASASVTLTVSK